MLLTPCLEVVKLGRYGVQSDRDRHGQRDVLRVVGMEEKSKVGWNKCIATDDVSK
jgi:hypothetical protein